MKKLLPTLFGLPFAGVGVGMLFFLVIPEMSEWQEMKHWQPVQATIISAKLVTHHDSEGGNTYNVDARYSYEYNGYQYKNSRVAISESSDNIGSFHEDLAANLKRAKRNNQPVTAYVNPDAPSNSVINRDLRWGLLAFKLIFATIFGLVGLGIIVATWWPEKKGKVARSALSSGDSSHDIDDLFEYDKPWLDRKEWATNHFSSGANIQIWVLWGIAIIWCGLSAPATIAIPEEIDKGNYAILVILLFVAVGIFLIGYAIKKTLVYLKVGKTPLTLDPYPGNLNGDIGGTIKLRLPYDRSIKGTVTLTHLHSRTTGSGKNRSTRHDVKWQSEQHAKISPGLDGTNIQFLFQPPPGLNQSEEPSNSYYLWRVKINIELPGPDLERTYDIPVFPTGDAKAATLSASEFSDNAVATSSAALEWLNPIQQGITKELTFPRKSGIILKIVFLIISLGLLSAATGIGISIRNLETFPMIMLYLFGLPLFLGSVYFIGRKLTVMFEPRHIATRLTWLGIPLSSKRFDHSRIKKLYQKESSSSSSGNNHTTHHRVYVEDNAGSKQCIGLGINGSEMADQVVSIYKDWANIDD